MTATATVTPLNVELTTAQQAQKLTSDEFSETLKKILNNFANTVRMHLPDNDSPESCWDICMRIAQKYPPISEVEFRVMTNRANAVLATMHTKGLVYRTKRQSMASHRDFLGFGVAKRSSYGYANRIGSQIKPGYNADNNPAKAAKLEAERRDKMLENQTANMNEVLEQVLDLIMGLKYHDLKAVRELVDSAMDDAVNHMIVESTSHKGAVNDKYAELKGMLEKQKEILEGLTKG